MMLIWFSLPTLISGFISCLETNYETIVLEPTNPFYKEQFQMNKGDFIKETDALGFGFWSQYRPYQDIYEYHQVDYAFQPTKAIKGGLLFSIRNVDTNIFETTYFLYYPLYTDYIYLEVVQRQGNSLYYDYFYTTSVRYEGVWIYTHFQFLPLMSELQIYFITPWTAQYSTLTFQLNQYGNKEIIIGGQGKVQINYKQIFNYYNLGTFLGRMSRPIMLQLQQMFLNSAQFFDYYYSCNVPKSCSAPIQIDIIKDQIYMDSTMYLFQNITLYENAYSFGGWVKVDFNNIFTRMTVPVIKASINRNYHLHYFLGDESFQFVYIIDQFTNVSQINVVTYSYITPQDGTLQEFGRIDLRSFFSKNITQNIQNWHFIRFTYGNKQLLTQIFFPDIQNEQYYYFFSDVGGSQLTNQYFYIHIGADRNPREAQFQGWLKDFKIFTCLDDTFAPVEICIQFINLACHFTCLPTQWCQPERKCEQCPIDSHRYLLKITKICECEEGYYTVLNQPSCENFQHNFQFLQFTTSPLIKIGQCQLGYYQYQNQCYECPQKISDTNQVSCLECINDKLHWYLNPVCETDYVKLIGDVNEPLYQRTRPINDIDLFKINSYNYIELCQGCYKYCDSLSTECFLSQHYHLGNQMIVQCKQNYYFDQNLLECQQCLNNCEICNQEGQCLQCKKQHYFDPAAQQCSQCDIRCDECQYDQQLKQSVCTSCPEYFTLYNGICLKCGVFCKFCKPELNKITGEVYARCYQCLENKKYFISFDAINCHMNEIENCIYAFQYYKNDRHIQTIDMNFEPMAQNSSIITACAKCDFQYLYVISENICREYWIEEAEYSIQENPTSEVIVLSEITTIYSGITRIQKKFECDSIYNCEACIYFNSDDLLRCTMCYIGYYLKKLRGNCIKCPTQLNCKDCEQQQKINKDHFKLEFKAFYEWFVDFDLWHQYEYNAQSQNEEDFEIVCTACHYGYELIEGNCYKGCPENCAECIFNDGKFQCLRCYDTIQGIMQTLVNNECIQCPFNCAICLPQDQLTIYQYNPYFNNIEYSYFTNLCLGLIKQLPQENYFYDPEIGNFIECGKLQSCSQEAHYQMTVHCSDQSFEQLLQSSSNQIEFKQQNIKLSQLFSTNSNPHVPEYENDIVFMRFNEKSIKRVNQTYLFTNFSECVISGQATLRNQFSKNVYSIKETIINFIGINNNAKIYFSNQLYLEGFTQILFKNIELISTAHYPVNSIIISHLIQNEIILENIQFSSQSKDATISFSAFNSTYLKINNCNASNLNFMQTNFINIQNPLWQEQGLDQRNIINVDIQNFSFINCTLINSSLIHSVLDSKFIVILKYVLIKAQFNNSFIFTQYQTYQFSKKIIIIDTMNVESKIIDTDGFLNFEYIDEIAVQSLTYKNSIINNSTFIKGNSEFEFENLNFFDLQMIGNSILLKYEATELASVKNILITKIHIYEVSYEQIHPFIYFVDQGVNNKLQLISLSLENNYLTTLLQNSKIEIFYYSALIYVEMTRILISNSSIIRMSGYQELALVNTQNITIQNLTINQREPIKGLHQYFDCLQQQHYGNQYYSVISIFQAQYTLLDNIQAQKLILYDNPLIIYQSIQLQQKQQSEFLKITNSLFFSNLILITQDIKSSSIILIQSEQFIEIEINKIVFQQNQLNAYSKSKYLHSCLINVECQNGKSVFNQIKAMDNVVTNSTSALFYLNLQFLKLTNSYFLRNNLFDYDQIKGKLMWSFPNSNNQITLESLQNIFPITSDGIFIINFEELYIDNITVQLAQGCKGGALQLYSQQKGIVLIINSIFTNIRPSLNCDQSFGGALYLDSTKSTLIATISQIHITNVMSLNLGGFLYLLSGANELNMTISNIEANNYQSLKGSFLYSQLQQSKTTAQQLHIYNCTLINRFHDFIEYLGQLSTFQNLDTQRLLQDRVQFYLVNGQFFMKQITILAINYEAFIYVSGCIQMDFGQLYFGGGNFSNNPLFSIEFDPLTPQKLNFDDIKIQNLDFSENSPKSNDSTYSLCQNIYELNITKLTLLCQQSLNYNLPENLQKIITTDFVHNRGLCYLDAALKDLIWGSFSFINIRFTYQYHLIKMNQIQFQNNKCNKCENGLMNIDFEQGLKNNVAIFDLHIYNSSCGTLGCLVLRQGQLDQSTLVQENNRLLSTLEKDYYNMNFTLKIHRYTCLGNTANFGVCLFIQNIEVQVIDSQFLNNYANISGGAIYSTNTEEQLSLIRTILQNNSADIGKNIVSQNQMLPNLTKAESYSNYFNNTTNQLIDIPQQLKITRSNHLYFQKNHLLFKNDTIQIDISILNESFYFPNGQSLASYQYFDLKNEQYVQLNLTLRLIALNIFGQEQTEILGTTCDIYSRMISEIEDDVEFIQNYTNLKSIDFNINTKDYNLDGLILYFDSDLQETMFLQLQFRCTSIKVPIYLENDPYNINTWHTQYFLRTSLIKPLPCQIGEIKQTANNICHLCDSNQGFYSVKFNSNKCQSKNDLTMVSVTSAQINLKQFYWRPYATSDIVENCFNLQSNCLGSWQNGDKSCFIGHIGALCEQCDLYNIRGNGQYSISSTYICGSCSSIDQNILIVCLVTIFTLLSIVISVKSTDGLIIELNKWRKHMSTGILIANEKALPGILIKILTNYLQIVGSLSTFKLQMPFWINSI